VDWWRAQIILVCCVEGSNPMDGLSVTCHSELQWVHLQCFGTNEITLYVWKFDEIKSSLGRRVAHCQGMIMYEVFDLGG
jgi:hypothetical protein